MNGRNEYGYQPIDKRWLPLRGYDGRIRPASTGHEDSFHISYAEPSVSGSNPSTPSPPTIYGSSSAIVGSRPIISSTKSVYVSLVPISMSKTTSRSSGPPFGAGWVCSLSVSLYSASGRIPVNGGFDEVGIGFLTQWTSWQPRGYYSGRNNMQMSGFCTMAPAITVALPDGEDDVTVIGAGLNVKVGLYSSLSFKMRCILTWTR